LFSNAVSVRWKFICVNPRNLRLDFSAASTGLEIAFDDETRASLGAGARPPARFVLGYFLSDFQPFIRRKPQRGKMPLRLIRSVVECHVFRVARRRYRQP
jgi:hypothetical protein